MSTSPLAAAAEVDDPEVPSPAVGPSKPRLLRVLGPGLITGASDDDPSGIATYSQAGAQLGYGLCWTMLYTLPLMAAVQMVSARIGRTTGHGIAGVLREHYPNGLLQAVVLLLLTANILNLGADLGAMADALDLLLPGPRWLYVALFSGICVYMQLVLQYARYVAVLKWLTLSLFAYLGVVIFAHVSWRDLGVALAVPHVDLSGGGLTTLVALFGTTISPYLFFWQAAEEAEDLHAFPRRRDLLHAPEQGTRALHRIEVDTLVGMSFSNLVALAIMVTTAAVLHPNGIIDIQTSAQAAEALRPLAGPFSAMVFALGIIGTGLLAVPVLAGSAAYAVGEARRWPVGFGRRILEARAFYGTVALATLVGMVISLGAVDPIRALYWSAVVNGVIAVPVMAVMMLAAARSDVMGAFAVRGPLKLLGWAATACMLLAVLAMFGTSVLPLI
ncbi:NRAMP family divalent metal transporter [Methylobacterium radiotolerans]|uniref:Mn2+/Fe2+ transporter, NRAMP family n=1 Tax=Methylobacterium radiotolerans (strain ATCC 27329 / DSM 1819 / JCM 2831 / NBRC 15690 / NCIMB 10815 / 0-1) TaxID=426355 RepID=B1M159_METRJ|nr:divalent metal cation transporter [Methylobacterium radiotolerans]ACB24609.1 Mn2+/Fe2+ transporter, NRAMP family [Methylobacterium radiotolerans JCM 2831]ONF50197.1 iron transporter [Methylobacterium radiotolerans]GEN00870.1 iron transporter [Methylobacterium radiotolerans]